MIDFTDISPALHKTQKQCSGLLRLRSIYLCARKYCATSEELVPGFDRLNETCITYGDIALPPLTMIGSNISVTGDNQTYFQVVERHDFWGRLKVHFLAIPSQSLFEDALRTTVTYDGLGSISSQYGYALLMFWGMVIVVHVLFRSSHICFKHVRPSAARRFFKQHITLPATFSHRCSEPLGWCTIPPRWQSLILIMFALMNVFLSFGNYDVFATNLFWPDTRLQYARYIADRVGVMSIANIPLVWLFATRNNLISYITGWPFETVIQFHRWIAIIATAQAIVHSIAYTIAAFLIGGLQQYQLLWLQRYWACGGLATFTMSVMVAFSVHPLMRKWFYEMFLFFHGVFAVVVLVGLWYHIEVFGGAYNGFLWPCIIVWVVDRLARLVRVFRLNSRFRKSIATYRTESNVLWLNVPSTERSPTAGSYYFLYVLHGFTCYQSHPFTLAGWEKREEDLTTMLTFAIRPYHGLTARLRDLVTSGLGSDPEKSGQSLLRVLVEGPYSPRHSLTLYDGLTFIAGGTGIAVALSYISGALAAVHDKSNKVRYNFRRFQLIWTVREQTFFQDTFDREIRPRLARLSQLTTTHNLQISVHIYMTGVEASMMPMVEADTEAEAESENLLEMQQLLCCKDLTTSENGADSDSMNELSINSSLLTSNTWTGNVDSEDIELRVFTHSRPRLENIVMTSASHDDAANNQGRYAIVACGPTSMADDTRMAVVKAVGLGYYIDFYSESYSW